MDNTQSTLGKCKQSLIKKMYRILQNFSFFAEGAIARAQVTAGFEYNRTLGAQTKGHRTAVVGASAARYFIHN